MHPVEQLDIFLIGELHRCLQLLDIDYHHCNDHRAHEEYEDVCYVDTKQHGGQGLSIREVDAEKDFNRQVHRHEDQLTGLVAVK